jgi:hypothetical protein
MANDPIYFMSPIGRLVQGSLYEPNETDAEGNPRIVKSGPNAGQPNPEYFFSIAVLKGTEQHWANTEWGAIIYNAGLKYFPNGQAQSPSFAWKVKDGDSQIPNSKGRKNCDREGWAGHWIINFKSRYAPNLFNKTSGVLKEFPQKDGINLGDYVQVYGSVVSNESTQQPGVIINHRHVALMGYGPRITVGPDPESLSWGGQLPPGASAVPIAAGNGIADSGAPPVVPPQQYTAPAVPPQQYTAPAVPSQQPVQPYTPILNGPPAAPAMPTPPPARRMTPKAGNFTYEQWIAQGWSDAQLIQNGMMEP